MELTVKTELNRTESRDKVLKALRNVFPAMAFEETKGQLAGESDDRKALDAFKEHLERLQVRDSARAFMLANMEEGQLKFGISKQAAYAGRISFVDFPVALGPIEIEITGKDQELEELVDWLAEKV
jgi:hypothetical protein